jgi:hypothetical protein
MIRVERHFLAEGFNIRVNLEIRLISLPFCSHLCRLRKLGLRNLMHFKHSSAFIEKTVQESTLI